jgi:isoleucyl-tRNA synthetase
MAFEKVDARVDYPAQERDILAFWDETRAFETLREMNRGNEKWSFLDGPITANNPMGVHHAWGRTYKDVFHRYHAAKGHDMRYQNGFDCQGLWIEVEVEKEHGFTNKKDIEAYGVGKFVEECKARADHYASVQSEQSKRLGYWMDWDNSYYTMADRNNYSIWAFLKKCHDEGHVYKGADVMPWCPRCGTGISQMEMNEGYRATEHLSVFVRFPLRDRSGKALLVWTTTPWTLTSNVAAAVKPDMKYLKVRCGDWTYYVGKGNFESARKQPVDGKAASSAPSLMSIQATFKSLGGFEIVDEVEGSALVGLEYEGPFDHFEGATVARDAHKVIAWEMVTESEGSGIVHIAPGCGSEDYHLGKTLNLPSIAPLDEQGQFKEGFGSLSGRSFVEVAADVAADLKDRGLLVAKERYVHRYPHCWRCKEELVYRLVDEWFINMQWRDRIMAVTKKVRWIPEWGMERELDWLRNMGDWMISKKRYWGLALPIWECDQCGHFDVIGSREELEKRATSGWDDFDGQSPHRPWIDSVRIGCEKCGHDDVKRVKDVGNPWLDASIVPFSTMQYFEDRDAWESWFPADFIVEALPGQFRNWFYALLAVGTMMVDEAPFKTLLGHGLVLDDNLEEMHKSKGNAIEFNQAADTFGVDVMRWMYCKHSPERNIAFGPVHIDEIRTKTLRPLWNTYVFFTNYARLDGFDPLKDSLPITDRTDLDRWILSDLHELVQFADESYSQYQLNVFCSRAEKFIDNLSNWYVRRSRRRFWKSEWSQDKFAAYQTLYEVLTTFTRLIAPIAPFVTESMYQNLVAKQISGSPSSVHHVPFPVANASRIDTELSQKMDRFLRIVSSSRAARTKAKLKVRQPLAELRIQPATDIERAAVEQFRDHLIDELNVKKVTVEDDLSSLCEVSVRTNMKLVGPKFGKNAGVIGKALSTMDARTVAERVSAGQPVTVATEPDMFELDPADISVAKSYGDDWASDDSTGSIILLDTRITPELKSEGLARDVVRHVQSLRKEASLNLEDRIRLNLATESTELSDAIAHCRDYVESETLAVLVDGLQVKGEFAECEVDVAGAKLGIRLQAIRE